MVPGNYAVMLGNYAVILGNIGDVPTIFFLKQFKKKTEPRFQDIAPILVHIFPQRGPHIPMKMT